MDNFLEGMRAETLDELLAYRYIERYINDQKLESDLLTSSLADQIDETSKLAPYVVIIPVAAHQEADNILPAARQYAAQQTDIPFTVIFHMNYPESEADISQVDTSFARADQAIRELPWLDLRITHASYECPVPIGTIRKHIWDATILAGVRSGAISPRGDIVALNHDIDVEEIEPGYMKAIQDYYQFMSRMQRQLIGGLGGSSDQATLHTPRGTHMRHAFYNQFPNASHATHWMDVITTDILRSPYEASHAIPLSWYAKFGGISADDRLGEVLNLVADAPPPYYKILPTPAIFTSPRRFIHRLHTSELQDMWSAANDFHPTEAYRDSSEEMSDISRDRLHQVVGSFALDRLNSALTYAGKNFRDWLDKGVISTYYKAYRDQADDLSEIQSACEVTAATRAADVARKALRDVIKHPDADPIVDSELSRTLHGDKDHPGLIPVEYMVLK